MHELAIATSMLDLINERFAQHPCTRVVAIYLRIGPLAGVVEDSLRFAFELAAAGTIAEGARLIIERTMVVVRCPRCGCEQTMSAEANALAGWSWAIPACPVCSAHEGIVVQGQELDLVAVEVADG